jgi:hypothetical protein
MDDELTSMDNYFCMNRDHNDWEEAWQTLARHYSNARMADKVNAPCPFSGESWQYMGSYNKPQGNVHTFRHRRHPGVNGERVNVRVFVRGGVK